MRKIIFSLLPLLSLCEKEREWGGRINLSTGEIEGPVEGEESSFSLGTTPEEEREKGKIGWAGFHSHPRGRGGIPEPSGLDWVTAHYRGTSEFVLTSKGIWEVRPVKVLPVEKVKEIIERGWSWAEAQEEKNGDPAYWYWVSYIRDWLPIEVNLIWKGGDNKK